MMYDGNGWGWSAMILMPVVWIVLLGVIVWAVVRLTQPNSHQQGPVDPGTARRESRRRSWIVGLASAEIDAETYAQTRNHLAGRETRSP